TMDSMASLTLAAAPMTAKLTLIAPEILLFIGSVVVAVLGLSRTPSIRRSVPFVTALFLVGSIAVTAFVYRSSAVAESGLLMPMLGGFAKALIASIAVFLVMVAGASIDRKLEEAFDSGRAAFDPIRVMRGEFFAFFLLAVAGTMLIANASDLIWLFLALELASLPTYVMVAVSRGTRRAQEAAVKYFFLGALSAATFLYGFSLLYGATGTLELVAMRDTLAAYAATGGVPTLAIIGGVLAVLGIAFKLAAVPMHFYAPDVYEGAGAATTAFLGFIPKVAGVLALMVLLTVFGWTGHTVRDGEQIVALTGLPLPLSAVLWMVAVLTMTLGNIGALLQRNVKRMLAYSSIAQSGYLLVGIIAGPEAGFDAVLFYLIGYGVMNTAIFAVLASLERNGEEVETLEDLSGLRTRHPVLAWMLAISAISLIGIPPLVGFFGKLAIFSAAFEAGQTQLVIIAAVNSAIGAFYYLQLVAVPMLGQPNARTDSVQLVPSSWPRLAAVVCGLGVLAMPFGLKYLVSAAASSTEAATGAKPSAAKEPLSEAPVIGSPVLGSPMLGSPMLDPNEHGLAAAQSS
ncbi:MAG: NADH-quinone oxidoreductase subunit N, partial [Planctomycetota bacterium]|nr:NADH-quinone oxidoreductase subunit N [Planctomycetota bacterium]